MLDGNRNVEYRPCPNCGRILPVYELVYFGFYYATWGGATIYNVCKQCADLYNRKSG